MVMVLPQPSFSRRAYNDLVGKMVHIDDYFIDAVLLQVFNISLQEALAVDHRQCFGVLIGPGFEPGTEACCEDHALG